jgi:kynureninase
LNKTGLSEFQKPFSYFFENNPDRLHFCAHSHHPWPDVTFEAQKKLWQHSAASLDKKWETHFKVEKTKAESLLKELLGAKPEDCGIVFASNTHELLFRILSTHRLPSKENPWKIICSDSEFYSFSRQMTRLQEEGLCQLSVVSTAGEFEKNFEHNLEKTILSSKNFDAIFLSHVFFNSGKSLSNLNQIYQMCEQANIQLCVIDGYHAVGAIPVQLNLLAKNIFYLGGGYKYLQSGEGCCFASIPKKFFGARPLHTGWFASFGSLSQAQQNTMVPYSLEANCYDGSTLDYSGIYRLASVLELWKKNEFTVEKISSHVHKLQNFFLEQTKQITSKNLLWNVTQADTHQRPRFLTFEHTNALEISKRLEAKNVNCDVRGNRLRLGFGMYHTNEQVEALSLVVSNCFY